VGSTVELEFKLPGSEDPLTVTGRVVRNDVDGPDGPLGMGIEFESLAQVEREQINEIIRKLRSPARD
jgi:hypothetical protein